MSTLKRRAWLKQASLISAGLGLPMISFNTLNRSIMSTTSNSDDVVRLLFNENPYGPSQAVLERIDQVKERSHRYATFFKYDFLKLKNAIANQEGIEPNQIALGHGSIQPLVWLSILYGGKGKEFVVPDPAFDVIGSFGKKIGTTIKPVLVDKSLKLNLSAMEQKVNNDTSLVVIVNPNNPTGTSIPAKALADFCKRVSTKCPVCIDEAYIHYLGKDWRSSSMIELIKSNPNIIITRTFSKIYGMAGLRMGYMMGSKELVERVERQFMLGFPGNMPNTIAVAAAMAAIEDDAFVDSSRTKNEAMKQQVYQRLDVLGWEYVKSDANFVYFNTGDIDKFKTKMSKNKILVAGGWPSKKHWGRVTVGTEQEMAIFFKAISS